MQHRSDEKRKGARKRRSQESVGGHGAGRVALEGVDQVVESGLEDGEEAEADEDGADARGDPVDGGAGGPGEDEETGAEGEGAAHHGR